MLKPFIKKGFSLLEVIFGIAIAAILILMTSVATRPAIDQEGPRGLAYSLAADLRAARAEAVRSGRMVAFCFASDNKTNSLSRSAYLRAGEQSGRVLRTLSYSSEYDATIFIGKWGEAERGEFPLPAGWSASTARELALFFGPDGRAFSPDILALGGRYPLVVASAMEGTFGGSEGTLSAVRNPQTVWVSGSGSIEVTADRLPVGALPDGGSRDLEVAELSGNPSPPSTSPEILHSGFLPEPIEGLGSAGIAQSYVQIHPNQKEGEQLEYGLATIEVQAVDQDGGPLSYTLEAEASAGEEGKFSIAQQQGEMSFVYDPVARRYVWKAVVSWRPPPTAPPDRTYRLTVTVRDPEGNSAVASTDAGLLPSVTSLPPARIVMCSSDQRMFLTNLDGANEVLLTRDGGEYSPFFSRDGSCVFSFHDVAETGSRQLRSRPANGSTGFTRLAGFHGSTSNVIFDPTYTFAALLNPAGTVNYDWGQVTEHTESSDDDGGGGGTSYSFASGGEDVPVSNIMILNLMSDDPPILVSRRGSQDPDAEFFWAANARHTFFYGEEVDIPEIIEHGYGPFSPVPGHRLEGRTSSVVGFPPVLVPADITAISAAGRIYNPADNDWYVNVEGSDLVLRNQRTGVWSRLYSSAGIESSASGRKNPSWSANGEHVAFIASPGSGSRVVSLHVLDSTLNLRSSVSTDCDLAAPNATIAQLSADAGWIYFLQDRNVYRADLPGGTRRTDITGHLGVEINDYVVSP